MKIALLHLDVAEGPETRNRRSIISAAGEAVSRGADWIVTPEMALQGYFFYDNNGKFPSFSEKQLSRYMFFAGRNKADMFLSAAEYDERDGKGYNSCFVINREGKFLGKHRKMFSHRKGFERWLSLGGETHVFKIGSLRVGLLVCADSYYEQPCLEIKKKKADMVLVTAAWPPGKCCSDPVSVWKTCSKLCGVPVIVCNQTGYHERMDMREAESVVIVEGQRLFTYKGDPAVLFCEWDEEKMRIRSRAFEVVHVK